MHDFIFTWINASSSRQRWSFESGDYFTLDPNERRSDEQQYDNWDTMWFTVSEIHRVTMRLENGIWKILSGPASIEQSEKRIFVSCTA